MTTWEKNIILYITWFFQKVLRKVKYINDLFLIWSENESKYKEKHFQWFNHDYLNKQDTIALTWFNVENFIPFGMSYEFHSFTITQLNPLFTIFRNSNPSNNLFQISTEKPFDLRTSQIKFVETTNQQISITPTNRKNSRHFNYAIPGFIQYIKSVTNFKIGIFHSTIV